MALQPRSTATRIRLKTTEARMEPMQPRRLEKKKNIAAILGNGVLLPVWPRQRRLTRRTSIAAIPAPFAQAGVTPALDPLSYLGVKTVILTGVTGNICVLFTANVIFMRDLHLASHATAWHRTLRKETATPWSRCVWCSRPTRASRRNCRLRP
jgi:hypothetical protein